MCVNKEVSLGTYILGTILSIVLFKSGDKYDKHIAIFSMVFISIQLSEFFMWSDQKCGIMNHYGTLLAEFILLFQPLSILILGYIYQTFNIDNNLLYLLIIVTALPILYQIIYRLKNTEKLCSKEMQTGHLEWDINLPSATTTIYMIFLFLPWLFLKNKLKGIIIFSVISVTYLLSLINFKNSQLSLFEQFESIWCFTATINPLVFLILNHYKGNINSLLKKNKINLNL